MTALELLIVLLLVLWLTGVLVLPIAGSTVHLLLVVILILIVVRLLPAR